MDLVSKVLAVREVGEKMLALSAALQAHRAELPADLRADLDSDLAAAVSAIALAMGPLTAPAGDPGTALLRLNFRVTSGQVLQLLDTLDAAGRSAVEVHVLLSIDELNRVAGFIDAGSALVDLNDIGDLFEHVAKEN